MYLNLGLVVFAVEVFSPDLKAVRLGLNPVKFVIPNVTKFQVHVYVVAENSK